MSEQINIEEIIFQEPRKTFMEILKVNQREVTFANVLAYFFRPNETHGLGDLFIQSLMKTNCSEFLGKNKLEQNNVLFENADANNNQITLFEKKDEGVKVEYPTIDGNRIDIVIKKDDFVICIEFKINHDLDNPLEDYYKTITSKYSNKRCYFIVLTPYKKEVVYEKAQKFIANNFAFKQVILSHFIKNVKNNLVNDLLPNDQQNYFNDFIQTIDNRAIKSKRILLFEELNKKIPKLKYNAKKHNGFFEIQKKDFVLKIRIVENGWQFEKWIDNNRQPELKTLPKDTAFESLVTKIKTF